MDYSIEQLDPINPSILDWVDVDTFLKGKAMFKTKKEYINGTTEIARLSELMDFVDKQKDTKLKDEMNKKFSNKIDLLFNE